MDEEIRYTGTDEEAMYLVTSILSASSDNSSMALDCFVMSTLCYPENLRKEREEADRVYDHAIRLPGVDDMVRIPCDQPYR